MTLVEALSTLFMKGQVLCGVRVVKSLGLIIYLACQRN